MNTNKWILISAASILIITAIVLSPVLQNRFVWDDVEYVVRNKSLSLPLSEAMKYFFEQNYFVGNYHPLTMIGFSLEYHQAKLNPEFYHKVNYLLHLLNVALVFWFIYLLSDRRIWIAAIVSLLFGIHPLHVESVAWISELKDMLFAFFYLMALIVYLKYQHKTGILKGTFYLACLLFFVLSMLSKPAAVSLPLSLLAIDFYTNKKFQLTNLWDKIPFFAGSIVFGLITIKAQGSAVGTIEQYNLIERIMLSSYAFFHYLIQVFVPVHMSSFHPFPAKSSGHFPWLYNVAPIGFVILIALLYYSLRFGRLILFGFLFFFFNIALVLQFIPVGMSLVSDRYTYIPYIGLFFSISMLSYDYFNFKNRARSIKYFLIGFLTISFIAYAVISFNRTKVWKSDKTLWTDVIRKYPDCATAYYNLGTYYFKDEKNNPSALINYNQTLKYDTSYKQAYVNRGIIYTSMKEFSKAESDLNRAISLDSKFSEAYKNLGVLYNFMGKNEKAIENYTLYLNLEPFNHDIYFGRGMTRFQLKQFKSAAEDFGKAIELSPSTSKYWYFKALALKEDGQITEARTAALQAQKLGEVLDARTIIDLKL